METYRNVPSESIEELTFFEKFGLDILGIMTMVIWVSFTIVMWYYD